MKELGSALRTAVVPQICCLCDCAYAETVMAIVERYHLGAIIGSATAGTNGNVAEIVAPTGCRTRFTGLRVNKTRWLAVSPGRDTAHDPGIAYARRRDRGSGRGPREGPRVRSE